MSICEGVISTIVGAIVGGAIGYFSALRVSKIHTFNQASAKFRAAFSDQIYELKKGQTDVYKILDDRAYESHLKAKIEFEPYLSSQEINALEDVWSRYNEYKNGVGQNIAPGSIDVRKCEKDNALEILNEILSYAQSK